MAKDIQGPISMEERKRDTQKRERKRIYIGRASPVAGPEY